MCDISVCDELMDNDDKPNSLSPSNQTQPRQRLRFWLTEQLDNETCPGCKWLDKEMKVFKLTWKHYGRPGFDEEVDAKMFREWARHTKRYSPGEPSDVSTWKTRFRNALHKMPDIEEMTEYHQLDGSDPYRVYRFRTPEEIERFRERPTQPSTCHPDALSPPAANVYSASPTGPSFIPPIPNMQIMEGEREIDNIKNYLKNDQLIYNDVVSPVGVAVETWNDWNDWDDVMKVLMHQATLAENNTMQMAEPQPYVPYYPTNNDSFNNIPIQAIGVKLFLSDKEVHTEILNNMNCVRIAYKPPPPVPSEIVQGDCKEVLSNIYGPLNAKQIYYPFSDDMNTQSILKVIERGLVLEVDLNGDIYALRLCQARVFYSDNIVKTPKPLQRSQRTRVYSFHHEFLPSLSAYRKGYAGIPSCERFFSFGQKWSVNEPLKEVFVHCSISHFLAKQLFKEARAQKPYDIKEISVKNDDDDLKDKLENIVLF